MDKTKLGITSAIGALLALPLGANAAPPQEPAVPPAQSFSDLLQPISNPVERLQVADAQEAQQARLIPVQYAVHHHHHHHHHHNRRWYMSHGYVWLNGGWVLRPPPRHHHHHHHHNHY